MAINLILDVLLFKLAFHTYEVLKNKHQIIKRNEIKKKLEEEDSPPSDANTELDLISQNSDESTMTLGGPAPIREKKIERLDENLDVKLNNYMMKWIIIIIFYQLQFVFRFLAIALPAIPLLKLCLGAWIMLPQFKGEFYFFHLLEGYIITGERYVLAKRSVVASATVTFFIGLARGAMKVFGSYISEECVVKSQDSLMSCVEILKKEVEARITHTTSKAPKNAAAPRHNKSKTTEVEEHDDTVFDAIFAGRA